MKVFLSFGIGSKTWEQVKFIIDAEVLSFQYCFVSPTHALVATKTSHYDLIEKHMLNRSKHKIWFILFPLESIGQIFNRLFFSPDTAQRCVFRYFFNIW